MNNLTINVKFPFIISKEKKSYISLLKQRNKRPNYFMNNENSKIRTINPFNSVDINQGKNNFFKSFSSNHLYITKVPSEEKNKIIKNKYDDFGLQTIPPNIKIKKKKENIKKYKELKYIGVLLGIAEKKGKRNSKIKLGIPLESRKDYFNFIKHKRNIFFNPNATSNFVHETNSNHLISSNKKINLYSLINNQNKKREEQEELLELRDKVPYLPVGSEKMMNQIKGLFTEDFKFNNIQLNEDFYQKFENRINFMEDIYKLPVIKNNLVKLKLNTLVAVEWKNVNAINHQTLNFLNQLKRKIQREKDEKEKKLEEFLNKKRQEEKEYEILENKNKGENIEQKDSKEAMEEEEKLKKIMAEIINKEEKREQKFEELYIIEEYFLHKNIYFDDRVSIASERLRSIFFNNYKD